MVSVDAAALVKNGVGFSMTETQGQKPSKVPAVTLGFWVVKIIATTLGEVGGNAVSLSLGAGYLLGTILFGVPLVITVWAQVRAREFHPSLYWATIALTTLAGTTMADFCDRSLGIGYLGGSLTLFALVLLSLGVWRLVLGSVDVETVVSPQAETFYWVTIMFSQTLGTALGDWMADSTGLGYYGSALLIAGSLGILAGMHFFTRASKTALFWAAFILTRPLGATLANTFDKPAAKGGLGVSDFTLTAALAVVMVISLLIIPQRAGRQLGTPTGPAGDGA